MVFIIILSTTYPYKNMKGSVQSETSRKIISAVLGSIEKDIKSRLKLYQALKMITWSDYCLNGSA